MNNQPIRVIKVGGSLFDLPDLGQRLTSWLDRQPPAFNLFIAGGGKLVDAVRHESLDENTAHWRCIDLMTETANHLAAILPAFDLLESPPGPNDTTSSNAAIFSPAKWLREIEPNLPETCLRESWNVTSDSIAARVAICLDATELVLLKSADPPSQDFAVLSECHYVDRMFPELAQEMSTVQMVNLRQFPCESLTRG